ncbi:GTPase [Micromonospora sp. NPDC127501]|uniref:GTPase n=1 Tax=Micromonospora sp. NPDC127501 TaxID=3154872 RepID=UPI003331FBF2
MDPWVTIPSGALAAYRYREEIRSIWGKTLEKLVGKKSHIVFTGMPGVGKTVLLDHLTGRGFDPKYLPPGRSVNAERGKVNQSGNKMAITVIPGQLSQPRLEHLAQAFDTKQPVDGVVHVVCNGFAAQRDPFQVEYLRENGIDTLEKYREHHRQRELEDFAAVSNAIRVAAKKHRKAPWLLVAADKLDLYGSEAERLAARRYYGSDGGAFFELVNTLRHRVGTDNMTYDLLPACAWIEDFEWAGEKVSPTLGNQERQGLILHLANAIYERCRQ